MDVLVSKVFGIVGVSNLVFHLFENCFGNFAVAGDRVHIFFIASPAMRVDV